MPYKQVHIRSEFNHYKSIAMIKSTGLLVAALSSLVVLMSSTNPKELTIMPTPDNSLGTPEFNFKYTETINTGSQAMPLVGQLSKDGDAMYYTSQTTKGRMLLYRMKRNPAGKFDSPERMKGLVGSEIQDILMPTLSSDEKTLVFVYSPKGFQKGSDLYIADAGEEEGTFVNVRPLDEINDPEKAEFYPWISPDANRIYFSRQIGKEVQFYFTERSANDKRFSSPVKLDFSVPKSHNNLSCWLSNNELEMFVLSGEQVYYASRTAISDNFSLPIEVARAESDGFLSGITITDNQKEMFVYNSLGFRNTQLVRFENSAARVKVKQEIDKGKIDIH